MRVALIHYWLVGMRGGEKVLESLCDLYPEADIYTHVYNPDKISEKIKKHKIHTTFIQKLPFSIKYYKHYLPLMPLALEQLDLRGYDLVISLESGPAKGVLTSLDTVHICYTFSPMRYLWDMYSDYLENSRFITRLFMRLFFHKLRIWDSISARRVDHFACISELVAKRIKRWWERDAQIIYPPVATEHFQAQALKFQNTQEQKSRQSNLEALSQNDEYYLCFGQLVAYKRVDLAILACQKLGRKLIVAGSGEEYAKLKKLANANTIFLGRVDDEKLVELYSSCQALIFPGEEDFGIIPLEANACGKPVIAYNKGGACDTVIPQVTGLLFDQQNVESLAQAILDFEKIDFDSQKIQAHAEKFSEARFKVEMSNFINKILAER